MNDASDNIKGSARKRATYKGCKHNNDSPGARVISNHSCLRSTTRSWTFSWLSFSRQKHIKQRVDITQQTKPRKNTLWLASQNENVKRSFSFHDKSNQEQLTETTYKDTSVCMKFITLSNLPRVFTWGNIGFRHSPIAGASVCWASASNQTVSFKFTLQPWFRIVVYGQFWSLGTFIMMTSSSFSRSCPLHSQASWRLDISFRCRCIGEQSEKDRHISLWRTLRRDWQSQWHRDHLLSSCSTNQHMTLVENAAIACSSSGDNVSVWMSIEASCWNILPAIVNQTRRILCQESTKTLQDDNITLNRIDDCFRNILRSKTIISTILDHDVCQSVTNMICSRLATKNHDETTVARNREVWSLWWLTWNQPLFLNHQEVIFQSWDERHWKTRSPCNSTPSGPDQIVLLQNVNSCSTLTWWPNVSWDFVARPDHTFNKTRIACLAPENRQHAAQQTYERQQARTCIEFTRAGEHLDTHASIARPLQDSRRVATAVHVFCEPAHKVHFRASSSSTPMNTLHAPVHKTLYWGLGHERSFTWKSASLSCKPSDGRDCRVEVLVDKPTSCSVSLDCVYSPETFGKASRWGHRTLLLKICPSPPARPPSQTNSSLAHITVHRRPVSTLRGTTLQGPATRHVVHWDSRETQGGQREPLANNLTPDN